MLLLILPTDALGRTFAPNASPVRIDLRSGVRTVSDACSVPVEELEARLYELPPPGEWPLELIGSRAQLTAAQEVLGPKGWDVKTSVVDDNGVSSSDSVSSEELLSPFRPNSFLHSALSAVDELHAADEAGLAVDLGCGSGRDAVHLASVLGTRAPRWHVLGIDNHEAALERGRALGRRVLPSSRQPQLTFESADLRKGGLQAALERRPSSPLRLVHGCRWLNVPLLAQVPSLLAPGGLFLWSTFLDPPDGSEPLAPPYRRSRRLSSGQMRQIIGERTGEMEVLYDGEGELLTRSRCAWRGGDRTPCTEPTTGFAS
jgi:SAM-dependent methyltransferase